MRGARLGRFNNDDTPIHRLDPRTKILGCLALTFIVLLRPEAAEVAGAAVLLALGFRLAKVPLGKILRGLRGLWIMLLLSIVLQAVLTDGRPLFSAFGLTVTEEGLIRGMLTSFRLVILLFSASLLTATTSPIKLASGFEKLLNPLSRLGVPVPKFAMLISIALRFIPVVGEEAEQIVMAQRSRGAPLESKSVIVRIRSMSAVLVPLLASSLQRAGELAVAMESRCYWGGAHETRLRGLRYARADRVVQSAVALLLLLSVLRNW
ncbi:energy-coupling factor transporter transmembrane protein EcfT [Paenibacillus sp. HN-1]|uniref:energy-coupling factor transporter transmembrane component T family protein n=1 Tax=Paenibacillus TaxID=44249 RepID=UPI001CA959EE|nr:MULTISPECIES: energy-coupling factor transporter transmembrane component T [Paenibacillus]MBY9081474.1 energy-coupling factor transporter transmembrane protein EcfT [Paenibacillus sp. CGMCC 1.18879]MBY9084994.1 energy-coupling factor transporter transmembrane protein EcfT [Paenibacillus sinensis]